MERLRNMKYKQIKVSVKCPQVLFIMTHIELHITYKAKTRYGPVLLVIGILQIGLQEFAQTLCKQS